MNRLKTSFLTRIFYQGKIARLKGGHCRNHPQTHTWQPRRAFLYGTRGTSTLCPDSLRRTYDILKLVIRTTPLSYPDILFGPNARILTKSLGREMKAIIVYTAKSMLDGTLLSQFKQPVTAYTPPLVERKDRDDASHTSHNF